MYRELGSLDAFGVPGGPYTGAPRTFRFRKLPEAVKHRLARCLSREELPTPLLSVTTKTRPRFVYSLAAAVIAALPWMWAATLPASRILPMTTIVLFVVPYVLAGWLVQQSLRRDQLAAGVYLFPLDIVEAHGDSLRVTPLGSLRNAGIRRDAGALWLELKFEHGASYRFVCPDDAAAERAYAKICEAHAAVERITFGRDLEETVEMDPFFAIRGEEMWAAASSARGRGVVARNALGVLAGAASGALVFAVVAARGDHALYRDAVAGNTEASYHAYLTAGGRLHRSQAEWALRAFEQIRGAAARPNVQPVQPNFDHRPDLELSNEQIAARVATQQDALSRYQARLALLDASDAHWPRHLDFEENLQAIFRAARDHGDDGLYFDFQLLSGGAILNDDPAPAIRRREDRLMRAFAEVLSQTVPASVLTIARLDPSAAEGRALVVHVMERVVVHSPAEFDIDFDVTVAEPARTAASFHLSMPAPKTRLTALRPRSVFALPATTGIEHDIDLLTARAFDRLYDEVYGLFFPGDPVVPLAASENLQ